MQPDGSVVNGIPTLSLAQRIAGIAPFYVASETFKLDDTEYVEQGLEVIPAELIAGSVTDRGVVNADQIWDLRQSA